VTIHPIRLHTDQGRTSEDVAPPTVGFVLYAGWHPGTSTDDLVQAVAEVADALRELAQDALPSAESVTAVAVSPRAGGHETRIEQLRHAVLELASQPPAGSPTAGIRASAAPISSARGLRIDRTERRVTVDGQEVTLTRLEFDLLAHFAAHPRRVFTRAELLKHVWDFASPVGSRTVDAHVRRLRSKLGTEAHRLETVRGVGYRWAATRKERLLIDTVGPAA
jgi:hypothetical protein